MDYHSRGLTDADYCLELFLTHACCCKMVSCEVQLRRPATWQAVAPCTLWTMSVSDLDTVVDLYPDLAPALQEAFHQHLKNQAKRTPGKAW